MKITLESDLSELARARRFVRESARMIAETLISEEKIGELQLAVTEALTNIIKHSYKGEPGRKIELVAEGIADGIEIMLFDWGAGFDPGKVSSSVFDGSRNGGFGLFIISKCVDFFCYSADMHNRNSVRLIKTLKRQEEQEEDENISGKNR